MSAPLTQSSLLPVSGSVVPGKVEWTDRLIPEPFRSKPDTLRQARLMLGFAQVGVIFGLVYSTFYALIGHHTGSAIIAICVFLLASVPLVMRGTRSLVTTGHWICLITMAGFTALCAVEKGASGHTIGWLASGSLIALLLLGRQAGLGWGIVAFVVVAIFCGIEFYEVRLPPSYDLKWEFTITAAGYLGFVAFLFILGAIFEKWRGEAFQSLEEAQQNLAKANQHLVSMNQEKNEFLGIVAHDLRNPLSTIMMCGELMALKNDPKLTADMSRRVVREAARMRELITELLDVNALENGNMEWNSTQIDLCELTTDLVAMVDLRAGEKQQDIQFQSLTPGPHRVAADRRALTQVLENLLSNAIKFSPPNSKISISIDRKASEVCWRIQDSGPGFTSEDRAHLFRKFARLSARPTAGEQSVGLGLSIVKNFVDRLGGTIVCEDEPGAGACFRVSFPVAS